MLAAERREIILGRLEKEGRVLVTTLSEDYGVSEETIRRDLERLESEGFARRFYGGASFTGGQDLPYSVRKKSNVAGKRRIAAVVAHLIPDGSTVTLDESSKATFVAQALREKHSLTVITNSLEIILMLSDKDDWNILLAGGALRRHELALTGSKAAAFIADYHVDWAIMSCAGLDLERGISDIREETSMIKRAMLRSAERCILAVDSRKFDRRSFATTCGFDAIDTLVTDFVPDEKWKSAFKEYGITLLHN